jgi:type VI secretion system protein ImpC
MPDQPGLDARIERIDHLLSVQLSAIMHAPEFQKLEGTWRGLHYLVRNTETNERLEIKVLNLSKQQLLEGALFEKVYQDVYGTFGVAPFGVLVADYEFGHSGPDIELLEKVSQVAAAAHAPFLTAASPHMFNLEDFTKLDQPRDLAKVFDSAEYTRWNVFRASEESRYVALILPRMLLREPFSSKTLPAASFGYEEQVDGTDHSKYLWGNAAWALAKCIATAFASYGWCAAIRGVESGGLIEGLPVAAFRDSDGTVTMTCATDVPISERREMEVFRLGFSALLPWKNARKAAFVGVQSAHKPKEYNTDGAAATARLAVQLPYVFAISRFAHYLKVMMRDWNDGSVSRDGVQSHLNRWISNYVVADDDAPVSVKAARPLREASIEIHDMPGSRGIFRAVALLRPHYQLDCPIGPMRLVAELPAAASPRTV